MNVRDLIEPTATLIQIETLRKKKTQAGGSACLGGRY